MESKIYSDIDILDLDEMLENILFYGVDNYLKESVVLNYFFQSLTFSKQYFEKNKDDIKKLMLNIVKSYNKDYLFINSSLIDNDLAIEISKNNNIKILDIEGIISNETYEMIINSNINKIHVDDLSQNIKLPYSDKIVIQNSFSIANVIFSKDFLINGDQLKVKNEIINAIKNYNKKELVIPKEFNDKFDKDIIKAISDNKIIEVVNFEKYIITNEIYRELINCDVKKVYFYDFSKDMDIRDNNKMIATLWEDCCGVNLSGYFISEDGSIYVKKEIVISRQCSDEEIDRLIRIMKRYPMDCLEIKFLNKTSMYKIISKLCENEIFFRIVHTYNINENDINVIKNIVKENNADCYCRLSPDSLYKSYSLASVDNAYKIIDLIVKEIKEKNLSPLEEYIYAYDIVKLFKEYKKEDRFKSDKTSRIMPFILLDDEFVCAGYANLLEEIVKRLSNPNLVVSSYSCQAFDEAHRRCLVGIKDEKYDINGVFLSDPTYDSIKYNQLTKNLYRYVLVKKTKYDILTLESLLPDITDSLFLDRICQVFKESGTSSFYLCKETPVEIIKKMTEKEKERYLKKFKDFDFSKKMERVSKNKIKRAVLSVYKSVYVDLSKRDVKKLIKRK